MAEKITHPILVGLLHPEGGKVVGAFRATHPFAPQPHKTLLHWDVNGCACKFDTIQVTITAAKVEGPFISTALRTVYQKHQNNNSFCKDIMKLYEKLEFRVHKDSLAFSYWRRCSFHCRFLLNFGGVSTSGSCTTGGTILFC